VHIIRGSNESTIYYKKSSTGDDWRFAAPAGERSAPTSSDPFEKSK
jgi:hypothetical protein